MPTARASFDVDAWDEEAYESAEDGSKLTRAVVHGTLTGDIAGQSAVQWLMSYRPDGTAHYVGLQRVTGSIDGRDGTVVIDTAGEFDGGAANGSWSVVDGTGTGGLEGVRGTGTFNAPHGSKGSIELEYEID